MAQNELASVLNRRRQEVDTKGAFFTKDRSGHADAVWYERTDSQFSPRSSERKSAISRLPSVSPYGSREASPAPGKEERRPKVMRRMSADAAMETLSDKPNPLEDRARRSFAPRRASTGPVLKAPIQRLGSARSASPIMAPSSEKASSPRTTRPPRAKAKASPRPASETPPAAMAAPSKPTERPSELAKTAGPTVDTSRCSADPEVAEPAAEHDDSVRAAKAEQGTAATISKFQGSKIPAEDPRAERAEAVKTKTGASSTQRDLQSGAGSQIEGATSKPAGNRGASDVVSSAPGKPASPVDSSSSQEGLPARSTDGIAPCISVNGGSSSTRSAASKPAVKPFSKPKPASKPKAKAKAAAIAGGDPASSGREAALKDSSRTSIQLPAEAVEKAGRADGESRRQGQCPCPLPRLEFHHHHGVQKRRRRDSS